MIGIPLGRCEVKCFINQEVTIMALFLMIGLVTLGAFLYAGVMLYSLKKESDKLFS